MPKKGNIKASVLINSPVGLACSVTYGMADGLRNTQLSVHKIRHVKLSGVFLALLSDYTSTSKIISEANLSSVVHQKGQTDFVS